MNHLDDKDRPCERHSEITEARLYELATLGSRMPSFHHDIASKLQSLMMALDEISELGVSNDPDLRLATDTAGGALRELTQLISANRALAKPPQLSRIAIAELVRAASERNGVKVRGEIPAGDVRVAVPAMTHAIALLLDLAAGPAHLGRVVDVAVQAVNEVAIAISGPREALAKLPPTANESMAIATFVVVRDGGTLRCKTEVNEVVVCLPLPPPPDFSQPLKRARNEAGSP